MENTLQFSNHLSHNNKFKFDKNKILECDTFRTQYFFHGCLIKEIQKLSS